MEALLALLTLPIMLLNFLGGIVGGIWLAVRGDWVAVLAGLASFFAGTFAISIALLPGIAVALPAGVMHERGNRAGAILLMVVGGLWSQVVLAAWCIGAFWFFLNRAEGAPWPYLLWSYAVATGPWTYMASKEQQGDPNSMAPFNAFFAQLGCISMMVGVGIFDADRGVQSLASWFLPLLAIFVAIQIVMVVATVGSGKRRQA